MVLRRHRPLIGAAFALPALGLAKAATVITSGYGYRRTLAVPHEVHRLSFLDGSVVLPFLETQLSLRSVANGGKVESAAGHDIRFEGSNGAQLFHDLAAYEPATGRVEAWLRFPGAAAGADLVYAILYGNPAQATAEANPTACWTGFVASWDMASGLDAGPNAAHLNLTDATATTLLGMDAAVFSA